jgi:hypothetical protein
MIHLPSRRRGESKHESREENQGDDDADYECGDPEERGTASG